MKVGERIKELRVSKMMTQADLAGDHITRNMLSCIENGSANPSLATILYLAGRLNVPAGFLLAEDGDEGIYRKLSNLSNIKRAYIAKDWQGCRSLCLSACPEQDDEIRLLLADCDAKIASEEYHAGRLRSCCRFFDEALEYADSTVYPTDAVKAEATVFFRLMERISPTLISDVLDFEAPLSLKSNSELAVYEEILSCADKAEWLHVRELLERLPGDSFYATHARAKLFMADGDYAQAEALLRAALQSETAPEPVCLWTLFSELEICCKEAENFKDAYRYANERIELLEKLLKEF